MTLAIPLAWTLALGAALAEEPPRVHRSDGRVEVRAVREGGRASPGELAHALGLPDGGRSLVEGCATTRATETAIVWVRGGPPSAVDVLASEPGLGGCLRQAFGALRGDDAMRGLTGVFVLRLGEWGSYLEAPRPGPFTKAHVDVRIVGGALRASGEATRLTEVDRRLAVLAQPLAACTPGDGSAIARMRVREGRMAPAEVAASTAALATCTRTALTDTQAQGAGDVDFVLEVDWHAPR